MTTDALDTLLSALPDSHAGDALAFYLHGLHPGDDPVDPVMVRAWLTDLHLQIDTLLHRLP